jgi:steroid 5-alpha reductase family enzyme
MTAVVGPRRVAVAGSGVAGLMAAHVLGRQTHLTHYEATYFLVFVSGARLLERTMMKWPGYREYAARTSMFFPWPPRQRAR